MNEAKIQLRLPGQVKDWLSDVAKQNDRSMNGQMVAILKEQMDKKVRQEKQSAAH